MIFNKKGLASLLVVLFVSNAAMAEEKNAYSLEQAIVYALQHNHKNKNALVDIEIAKKKVWETTAIGLPQLNAEAGIQKFLDIPVNLAPANSFNPQASADELVELQFGLNFNNSAGFTLSQLIFDGSYIVGLQAAKTYKALSVNNQVKTEVEVKNNVTQSYYTVLAVVENISVLQKSLDATKKIHQETKALYEAGLVDEQSFDQLTLNVNMLKTSVGIAEGQLRFAKKLLKLQMGMDVNNSITLTEDIDALLAALNTTKEQKFDLSNHVDYNMIETDVKLKELSLKKERYAFFPSVGAFLSHTQQNMSNTFDVFSGGKWFPSTILGATVKLPIFASGARLSKVGQARLELEKSLETAKEVEQGLIYQAQLAESNFETAQETFQNQKDNVDLANKIYDKTVVRYKEGLGSSLELTQAQTQMLAAQGDYIKSVLDLLNAKANMDKSYGKK